jgi:antitoxin component YwqK of YwqJK toxin-antitoxin module
MKAGRIIALCICILFAGKAFSQVRDSIPLIIADSLKAVYIYADTGRAINRTDAQGRKQGLWEKRYPNGKLRYRGHFRDNNPNGVFKYYWNNDSIQNIAVYSNGGKTAYSKAFYENGGVFSMGKFVTEKRDSIWLFYDETWKLYKKEQYTLGKKEGRSISFYGNGNALEIKTWHNYIENGPWQQFFENGQLKLEASYVNGKREGTIKTYAEGKTDRPVTQGNYVHDLMNGPWIFFNSLNDTWDTIVYKNNMPMNAAKYRITQQKLDSLKVINQGVQDKLDHPSMEGGDRKGGGDGNE